MAAPKSPRKKSSTSSSSKVQLHLDGKTGMFFAQLLQHGLATYKEDPEIPEGEIHASIEREGNESNIVLHMHSAFFVPEVK